MPQHERHTFNDWAERRCNRQVLITGGRHSEKSGAHVKETAGVHFLDAGRKQNRKPQADGLGSGKVLQ